MICRTTVVGSSLAGLALLASALGAAEAPPLAPVTLGETVLGASFAAPEERQRWSTADFAAWAPEHNGATCLRVSVAPADAAGGHMIRRALDLTRYRGCRLRFECQAKAQDASQPSKPYLGVKYMLHYSSPGSGPFWHNQSGVFGTFDWKPLTFVAAIAADAGDGELDLGLQDSSGTAWFDDLKIAVVALPRPPRPAPPPNPPPAFRGHDLPRLRGVMSPNAFHDEDLRVLGQEWKANLIRWQITRNWGQAGTDRDLEEYDRWLEGKLTDLDHALEACARYGIKVVVDLHSPPGGRYANRDMAIFHEALYQDHFVAIWERIARRYLGNRAIWGYDLVNEPAQTELSPPGVADYLGAQVRAAKAIRAIDPERPIFIEANQWDSPPGFADLDPVDVPNVIYQVHMYFPGSFTHQGVFNPAPAGGIAYPGQIDGQYVDKEALRRHLQPVREFQLAYNVHIYVGEFSAIRWAPGDSARRYLQDCIEIFEEYGWDWSYHAYREWDGWSVEHGPDRDNQQPSATPTDRKRLLLEWFARNARP
jgi:endoglucanase